MTLRCVSKLSRMFSQNPGQTEPINAFYKVVVAGRNSVKLDRKQERAEKLYLHYVQRWAKDYLRRRLDWIVEDFYGRTEYASNTNPRHLRSALCPCQVSLSYELQDAEYKGSHDTDECVACRIT